MAKKTYNNQCRKVIYMNFKYAKLYDAYAFDMLGNYGQSLCGYKLIRAFLDKIPEHEQKKLIANYDEMRREKYAEENDGN